MAFCFVKSKVQIVDIFSFMEEVNEARRENNFRPKKIDSDGLAVATFKVFKFIGSERGRTNSNKAIIIEDDYDFYCFSLINLNNLHHAVNTCWSVTRTYRCGVCAHHLDDLIYRGVSRR